MRLLLVRHAESMGNVEGRMQGREETDLSEAGREQARRLHDRLVGEGLQPTCVLSSPQRRTAQTAEIVCRSWSGPIELWNELVEHDVGVLTGLKWEEIETEYPVMGRELLLTRNWDLVEGAERMRDRRARGERIVQRLLHCRAASDVILVFTHGGTLQHVLSALLGSSRTWGVSVRNTALFDFSLDLERWAEEGDALHSPFWWRIERFNDASHLPEPPQ